MLDFNLIKNFATIESVIVEEDWKNIFNNNKYIPTTEYYNFYYSYGKSWKPNSILEIGVRLGYSGVSMVLGAGDSLLKFVGIDSEIDVNSSSNIAQKNLLSHTKAEVTLINLDTQKDDIPNDIGKFDLIHIDADHTFSGCINDILLALSFAKTGTRIIVDDCLYAPVRAAVEAVISIYHTKLNLKYVTNFRGHGLIETLNTFPELEEKNKRDVIANQQKSPFAKIKFSSIAHHYSIIRTEISQVDIKNNSFPNYILDFTFQIVTEADLYLKDSIQALSLAIKFYQDNGFCVDKIIQAINSIESYINSQNNHKDSFIKKIFSKTNSNLYIYEEIYNRLYLLNRIRLQLINNNLGKCFSHFCKESTKHLDYLVGRIDPENNSYFLPTHLPGLENYRKSKTNIFTNHEGYLLIIVLSDALINILSCFECELESQYWMRYWDIKNNETWNKLIINNANKIYDSPTPFPIKRPVEYEDFYKMQHIGNAGGIRLTNFPSKDHSHPKQEKIELCHPTDHLFRIFTTISNIELILTLLKERHPGETIKWLDVGCGIGFISNRVQFDGILIGIDVADSLIEYANATQLTENHKYVKGEFNDARKMIQGEKFHLITANEVVEHIIDPLSFIREMSQHTSDLIYASSPLMEEVPYTPQAEHVWSFTLESYIRLFEESGMKITYSGICEVGKYTGNGHNWLSVAATINHPFRVFPLG
ncbi:class I SAM-dependent methyltransferase [Umezakia ovalisporum]|uniref:Methyltransferase domain-containing protein n=1 Tax=Umezakia ovalisporum FSS-62 TaxID=2971776 RepID=A0AA43GYS8_9CYAN|nr:class I SAM-dependent methyltransferase [Umezakia ovalisporum]MDH6063961.1 methyltransferase domain-containing protein [Umezakia ovalisporum FSS-62]